jgi:hypothetical protein
MPKKTKAVEETSEAVSTTEETSPTESTAVEPTAPTITSEVEPEAPVMNFTYSIINDGKQIQKKFEWDASPQDVIMTLFSCMIGDIKTNIQPEAYEEILNYLVLQYKALLLPTQVVDAK